MLDKKTGAAVRAGGGVFMQPVRRVDWDQCTILSGELVDGAACAKTLAAVRALIARINLDVNVPLYAAAIDGSLLHVSPGYRELARASETVSASLHGSDAGQTLPAGLLAVMAEVQNIGRSVTLEEKILVRGQLRHYRSRHFPIADDAGVVVAVGGTYTDCTKEIGELEQAKATEARFRDFARASSDWFWETDRDMRIVMLSDRLTALLGIPVAHFIGRRLDEIGELQTLEDGAAKAVDAMAQSRPFRSQLLEIKKADGAPLIFHLSGVPVFDVGSGKFHGYRGAGMDVTSHIQSAQLASEVKRNLENTLEELTNKNVQLDLASAGAAQALKVKNDFLAAMSHELRTPLNAIIGFAEAMKLEIFGNLTDQYKSYSGDILHAGRHLLGLINDLLDVAVLESDKIVLDPEPANLKAIVDGALNLIIMRANKKNIDTSAVTVAADLMIFVDVRRATQVLLNLLSNAVKFTPEGGRLGIDAERSGDDLVAVTVWDTGIGIAEDKHDLVFDKFQQCVDNVYARREQGTGLGLHISRHLAQLMGGDISLESRVGEGSRFRVTFPLAV